MADAKALPEKDALADDLAVLRAAAAAGAEAALAKFRGDVRDWSKGDGSPVSEADLAADAAIGAVLREARPQDGRLTEENGLSEGLSGRTIIVDPIDGTRAFLDRREDWTVAIALVAGGRPLAGVIYQPLTERWYTATLGGGAHLNGARLSIPTHSSIPEATVAAAMPIYRGTGMKDAGTTKGRYVGSLALRMGLLADGTFHGVVTKAGPHHWDLAAGDLIVHEAGGSLTSLTGVTLDYGTASTRHGPVLAGSPELVALMRPMAEAHFAAAV